MRSKECSREERNEEEKTDKTNVENYGPTLPLPINKFNGRSFLSERYPSECCIQLNSESPSVKWN